MPAVSVMADSHLILVHFASGTNVGQKWLGKDVFTTISLIPAVPTNPRSGVLRCCEAISKLISLNQSEEWTQFSGDPREVVVQKSQEAKEV